MKYYVETLGCKVNTYESEALKKLLDLEGYENITNATPDIIIINTCSVTSVSDQKCRQKIRSLIRKYPSAIMVVMGCYSQMDADTIKKIDGVNIIVGTNNRHLIPKLIKEYLLNKKQINIVEAKERNFEYEELEVSSYYENTRAYLKIQDGCDNFCSYCIIPYARGKMRSRPKDEVLKEVKNLLDHGFKEIVLTGIHTAGYGKEFSNYSFTDLVKDIIKDDRLKRLRVSSIEESEITEEFINLMAENKVLARHLHIPLQSGSENILKRMNRRYNKKQFKEKIDYIRSVMPDIAITTDIIVGFPGETEEEFTETLEFAKMCQFAKIHVFPFSSRVGTPASKMSNQIPGDIKKARVRELLSLSNKLENSYQSQFIDKTVSVIFESYDEDSKMYKGHSSNYLLVYYESDCNLRNEMLDVIYKKLDSVKI
ncbi:MAG: tRNA (N(6)-L-threonylcarbamoyladenosine(37)-C(2))-methylthiotransferase MtaB [Erysipelotrichales bacterium]|nr:tRNA (N(6)-L-threonylcarbamoyladenosine(37)-C(2))-methylthiotransferase MtaB [Erysipelotrichales bacterium]